VGAKFEQTCWTQQGVDFVIKHIPGEARWGVLSPEEYACMTDPSQIARIQVIRSGDIDKIRSLEGIKNVDLTKKPISQWNIKVAANDFQVPVTAYCLTSKKEEPNKPAVLYTHGGGWCYGSRVVVENPCRLLAEYSGAIVFSTEYRLAPENKYPIGLNDCHGVLKYVYAHAEELGIDKSRIIVSGDSAGGNLSAALSRRDRNDKTGMIRMQALLYPAVSVKDPENVPDYHFSLDDYNFDDGQTPQIINAIMGLKYAVSAPKNKYVTDEQLLETADVSPLYDADFSNLPKTLIICAEYDFLTQQSKCYARKLAAAGVPVKCITYRGMKHAFIDKCGVFPQAEDCIREMAEAILAL
jgi:acetyl esterase/lipase